MYRAYFIGGPDDLTVRMISEPLASFRVPLMNPISLHRVPLSQGTVEPRVGQYRRIGGGVMDKSVVVYEWDGEIR